MSRSDLIKAVALACLLAGCNEARADGLGKKVYAPAELEALGRDGPAPESSSQRFLPDRAAKPPPAEKSAAPSRSEWEKAPDATEARITDPQCTVKRLREWYRVQCPRDSYVSLVGGAREDVTVGGREDAAGAWMVFPARVGDVRAVEFLHLWKWSLEADALLTEQWLPGDPGPSITLTGIR